MMHAYLPLPLLLLLLLSTFLLLLPSTHADTRVIPLCGPILNISSSVDTFSIDLVLSSPTSTNALYGGFAEGKKDSDTEIMVIPCICRPPCPECGNNMKSSSRFSSIVVIGQNNSNALIWNAENAATVKTMQYTLQSRSPGSFNLSWYFLTDDETQVISNIVVHVIQGPAPLPTPRFHYPLRGSFYDNIRKTNIQPPPTAPPPTWMNDDLRKVKVWNLTSSTSTYYPTGVSLAKSYTKSAWVFRAGMGVNLHLMSSASAVTDTATFPPTIHYLRVPPDGGGAAGHGKYDNTAVGVGAALASFNGNGWNHVVVTYDTTSRYLALYINGVPTRDSKLINTGRNDPWNGGDEILLSSATQGWIGRLSDVMYWDLALSTDQVAQLYQDQLNPTIETTTPPTTQAPTTTSKPTTTTAPTTSTPTSTLKPTTPTSTTSPPTATSKPTTTSLPTTTSRPTTTSSPPRSNSSTSIQSSTSISSTGTNIDSSSSSSSSASPSPFATYPDRIMVQTFSMYVIGNVTKYTSFVDEIRREMAYIMGIPAYRTNVTNIEAGDTASFVVLVLYPDWYDISSSTSQLSSLTTSFIQKLNTTLLHATMNNTTWLKTVNGSTLKTETTFMYLCNDWYYFTCDKIELSSLASSVATVPIGGVIAAVVISLAISLALVIGFLYAYFRSTHGDVSAKALRSMVQREGSAVFTHTSASAHPFNSFKSGGKSTFGLGPHRTGAAAVQLTANIFTPPAGQHTTPTTTTHSGSMTISPLPTTRTLPGTNTTKTTMSTEPGATPPAVSSPSITSASRSLNAALMPGLTSSNDIDNYS